MCRRYSYLMGRDCVRFLRDVVFVSLVVACIELRLFEAVRSLYRHRELSLLRLALKH